MNIKEINAKSIITKSNLPEAEYVINPYTGCSHGCIYCYARFMKRFSGHDEDWGKFVDIKTNAIEVLPKNLSKYKGKSIIFGSVTDPYQPIEKKYKLTRKLLEKLVECQPSLEILTKSSLVTRDIDLIKKFKDALVSISFSTLDEDLRKRLDPGASPIKERITALEKLHKEGIRTICFISPILPEVTDWKSIIKNTKHCVGEYWFENLNFYGSIRENLFNFMKNPKLISKYKKIYSGESDYWDKVEENIRKFCRKEGIKYRIFFHHKSKAKK